MKRRIGRGEYGHIRSEKRSLCLGAVLMVVLAVALFFLGLLLNRWEKRNIFSVAAVLFVLPWARYVSTLVVLLPYHTAPKEQYEKIVKAIPANTAWLADYVFSSKDCVMGLSYLVLTGSELIGLAAGKKEKKERLAAYLEDVIRRGGFSGTVVICETEEEFLKKLSGISKSENNADEQTELKEALRLIAI